MDKVYDEMKVRINMLNAEVIRQARKVADLELANRKLRAHLNGVHPGGKLEDVKRGVQ